ncbi:MAG: adenylate/guanylate cyclase domain-containing protein [Candidatus Dormiibacterota bacterium]
MNESLAQTATLPTGTATFVFTDIEGSTKLVQQIGADRWRQVLEDHHRLLREQWAAFDGREVNTEGDAFFVAFPSAANAVAASAAAQRALSAHSWSDEVTIRVRMGLHTGEAQLTAAADYLGIDVHRAARIAAAGHGGQVLLSESTRALVLDALPDGVSLIDLGEHRLKDLARAEHIYQLVVPGLPTEFAPLRSREPTLHNLPAQRTALIGRSDVLERVNHLLAGNRMLTLTGVGGSGKTRLAIEATNEMLPRFKGGALFVDLAAISDPSLVWTALASAVVAVEGSFGGSPRPLRDDLLAYLQDRSALVLLDNCEHLVDACAALADDLLVHCPSVSILATSREPLGIEGEQTFVVPSLDLPGDENPEQSASVELFVARATAARPEFELTSANLPSVVETCLRLDGIPLAIELAAALVAHLSPRQIADHLNQRFKLLTGTRRRVQRQQTLQATMDWSYELLTEAERILLRRLAVFPGSFDLTAVEAVCGLGSETVGLTGSLVARSLLGMREQSTLVSYRLLETVRLYAEERLAAAAESETYRARHRDHYLNLVEATPVDEAMGIAGASLLGFDEIDNLRAALEWSAGEGRYQDIGRILLRADAWSWTGAHEEAKRWLAVALEHDVGLEPERRLELLAARDLAALARIDTEALRPWARTEALGLSGLADRCILIGLYVEGIFASFVTPEESVAIADEGLRLVENGLPSIWSGFMHVVRGEALTNLGDLSGAVDAYRGAEQVSEPRGYTRWWGAFGQAIALHMLGQHGPALEAVTRAQAFEGGRMTGLSDEVIGGCGLALATAGSGDLDRAEEIIAAVLDRVRRTNVPALVESCLATLGWVAAIKGEYERASRLIAASGGFLRSPSLFAVNRHYIRVVRDALDAETARRGRAEGLAMTRDEAIAEALRWPNP